MNQQVGLTVQEQTLSSTSVSQKKVEASKDREQLLASAQLAAIVDALVQIQAHVENATAAKVDTDSSNPTLGATASNPSAGSVGSTGPDWHSKETWKSLLQELLSLLSSGSPAALAKFLKIAGEMLDNLGDCPADLKGKITALLKEVFSKFLGQKGAWEYMAELYSIYYQELKQQGDPNAAADAQKMMKDLFNNIQNELGIDVSAYYQNGDFTSGFKQDIDNYLGRSLSELFSELQPAATAFFNTGSGGIFSDIEGYLNSAYAEIVKNEPFWEKVMDVMNIWSYLYSNASMAKFNATANAVNEVKELIAEMQNDLNTMASNGENSPASEAAAKDFAAKYQKLQGYVNNPNLGDPNTSGSAANSLQSFLNSIGNEKNGKYSIATIIGWINKEPSSWNIGLLTGWIENNFKPSNPGKTPNPDAETVNTAFTNAEGTFSTLAQTTGMQVQNQSTNMDTLIKLSNSARNIMNQLIRPMTTYTGS